MQGVIFSELALEETVGEAGFGGGAAGCQGLGETLAAVGAGAFGDGDQAGRGGGAKVVVEGSKADSKRLCRRALRGVRRQIKLSKEAEELIFLRQRGLGVGQCSQVIKYVQ